MRKFITIILLLMPLSLFAQDRYVVISEKDAPALKQYKINWHTGIDPVKIKTGEWVLPEKVIALIPSSIKIANPLDAKIPVITDLREYLISRTVVTLVKTDFIQAEIIEPIIKEPIIIKR